MFLPNYSANLDFPSKLLQNEGVVFIFYVQTANILKRMALPWRYSKLI